MPGDSSRRFQTRLFSVKGLGALIQTKLLPEIQSAMFAKAKNVRYEHLVQVTEWKDFCSQLGKEQFGLDAVVW